MPDRQQPERDLPAIETPVIQSQDLEHTPGRQTRVNNSGVKIEPSAEVTPLDPDQNIKEGIEVDET